MWIQILVKSCYERKWKVRYWQKEQYTDDKAH
jgi:hypothetical protein